MPWTVDDVEKHKKGLTDTQREKWVRVANAALVACEAKGDDDCEGRAIRIANAVVEESDKQKSIGTWLRELIEAARVLLASAVDLGEAEKITKHEDGKDFPASDYAYVPDLNRPSTWKLRLTAEPGGPPDPSIVGAACAALGKGFRGEKVDIPEEDLPKVKAKVRAAWRKANPDKDDSEMPDGIKESEATALESGFVPLVEKSVRKDGTIPIKIIAPGWGTSGYYPPEVLERDGPKVFSKGLKMYWNHPTATEEAERPERDLRDLAATLLTDATYRQQGPAGPGLYAEAQVFGPYREAVDELAPHIGVSINALGRAKPGEAEGRQGNIIEGIVAAKSVDFVTAPGAGGQVLQLFESVRQRVVAETTRMEESTMNEQEAQALREAKAALEVEVARLRETLLLREASDYVAEILAKIEMPELTRKQLIKRLSIAPVIKEGKLDKDVYKTQIEEAARAELTYLAEVAGTGRITGMGSTQPTGDDGRKLLMEAFKRAGLTEEQAAIAAAGR